MILRETSWIRLQSFIWKARDNTFLVRMLVFEMFQRFSNTQTYLNKQTMSWCKDFFVTTCVFERFFCVKLTERCQHATFVHCRFVSRSDTSTGDKTTGAETCCCDVTLLKKDESLISPNKNLWSLTNKDQHESYLFGGKQTLVKGWNVQPNTLTQTI